MNWRSDLTKSHAAFADIVWPSIQRWCGGGEIRHVEIEYGNDLAQQLDLMCGIDVWQTVHGEGCRGIASRVQFGPKNWGTFTIRTRRRSGAKTEFEKRKMALETGRFVYPYLTCQAYVNKGVLLGAGLAKTKSIYDAVAEGRSRARNGYNNADFIYVNFNDVDGIMSIDNTRTEAG